METKKIRQLVGNKIFTAEFLKKDGTLRKMNCRLGVTKHLKGGELKYNPDEYNYLPVFDLQAGEYRTINLNTLKKLTVEGVTYDIE